MRKLRTKKITKEGQDAMAEAIAGFFFEFWTKRSLQEGQNNESHKQGLKAQGKN